MVEHGSVDDTRDRLVRLGKRFDVRVLSLTAEGENRQGLTYKQFFRDNRLEFDCIGFLDCDDFLMPTRFMRLADSLKIGQRASGIAIPWRMYGSSGQSYRTSAPVFKAYRYRASDDFPPNGHVKSIVRPMEVVSCVCPHFFDLRGGYIDPEGQEPVWSQHGIMNEGREQFLWHINHYFTKSRADWDQRMSRGQLGKTVRTWADFEAHDRNEILDPPNLKLLHRVEQRMRMFERRERGLSHNVAG